MLTIEAKPVSCTHTAMEDFWAREDIILVVPGSLPCIRDVYLRARAEGKLNQFAYVHMEEMDYVMGTAEDRIRDAVRETVKKGEKWGAVIIYLSCLDILTRLDFSDLEKSLTKETGCTVRCFFRGPMAAADGISHLTAAQMTAAIPRAEPVKKQVCQLPPPVSDGSGISDWKQSPDTQTWMLTPPGCRSCMRDGDMSEGQKKVYAVRMKAADFIYGMEERCAEQIQEREEGKETQRVLIQTAVPAFIGLDHEAVMKQIHQKNKDDIFFPSDGFHDAMSGISRAEEIQAQTDASFFSESGTRVIRVLGYSPLLCGHIEDFHPCAERIKAMGYEVCYSGRDSKESQKRPVLNWVVSSAGLKAALWMKNELGIPFTTFLPIGKFLMSQWEQCMKALLTYGGNSGGACKEGMTEIESQRTGRRLLLMGDPVHTRNMELFLQGKGKYSISRAAYSWSKESEALYRSGESGGGMHYFKTLDEWRALAENADVVAADPVFHMNIPGTLWISFYWGYAGGQYSCCPGRGIMGRLLHRDLESL